VRLLVSLASQSESPKRTRIYLAFGRRGTLHENSKKAKTDDKEPLTRRHLHRVFDNGAGAEENKRPSWPKTVVVIYPGKSFENASRNSSVY